MATDYTKLSITLDRAKKVPRFEGLIAVKEMVELTIVDGAEYIDSGLTLKIQDKNMRGQTVPIAVFPLVDPPAGYTNTWTATGTDNKDAMCYLNMNTAEGLLAFEEVGNLAFKPFNIVIFTTDAPSLDANGVIAVSQFPSGVTADPITLDQTETINALKDRVTELEAGMLTAVHQSDFDGLDFSDLSNNDKRNAALRALLTRLQGNI